MAAPEIVEHGIKVPPSNISVSDASGWRPKQSGLVAQFVGTFVDSYMASLHRCPRLLVTEASSPPKFMLDSDGTYIIDDGKSTILALLTLQGLYSSGYLKACCLKLEHVLNSGELVVQTVLYPTADFLERQAHNVQSHGEENKQLPCKSWAG